MAVVALYNNIYSCYQLLSQRLLAFLSASAGFSKNCSSGEQSFQWPHLWLSKISLFFISEVQFRTSAATTHSYVCIRTQNAGLIPQRGCKVWRYGRWLIWQRGSAYTGLWFKKTVYILYYYISLRGVRFRKSCVAKELGNWYMAQTKTAPYAHILKRI